MFSITGCRTGLFTAILLVPQLAAGQDEARPPAAEANAPVRIFPEDPIRDIQAAAVASKQSDIAYWGTDPLQYSNHTSHSNRLIPVYTFGTKGAGAGIDLDSWFGTQSVYRSADALQKIYGYLPERTVNPSAIWMDQTNVFDIQAAAASAGRKYIFLVVFDGMDWQTTHAAAIWNSANLNYKYGRGSGNHFQSYTAAGTTQFGYFVTSPHNEGTDVDVDAQTVLNPGGTMRGGYDASVAGIAPWSIPVDPGYMISKGAAGSPKHAYTDSSSSASSMTAGIKTFNGAINVDPSGQPVPTIAHMLQSRGWKVGAVSSVPISHATPACTYAHNVARDDYQDLTRDMLGLPSIAHPSDPLPGMDVVIGGGYGVTASQKDGVKKQGKNFVEGPSYLTEADLQAVDVQNGGRYVTAVRTAGQDGTDVLNAAAGAAAKGGQRLLGFFGNGHTGGHLPFITASGSGQPAPGIGGKFEVYTDADLLENPTLAEMTVAALEVLGKGDNSFWLMVEAGDVDWANHDNNLDNSIGAVNSGDAAVRAITDWVELNSNWSESLLIVTADHGHMLNITAPQKIADHAVRFQNFEKRRLAQEKQQAAQRERAAKQTTKAEDAKKADDANGEKTKAEKKSDP